MVRGRSSGSDGAWVVLARASACLIGAGLLSACLAKTTPGSSDSGFADAPAPRDSSLGEAGDDDAGDEDGAVDAGPPRDAELGDAGFDGNLPEYFWWQDVRPIVEAKCMRCHGTTPMNGAPQSLVTYEDVTRIDAPSNQRVYQRMAFWLTRPNDGGDGYVLHPITPPLATREEVDTIVLWAAAGAPEGTRPDSGVHADSEVLDAVGEADADEGDAGAGEAGVEDAAAADALEGDALEGDALEGDALLDGALVEDAALDASD